MDGFSRPVFACESLQTIYEAVYYEPEITCLRALESLRLQG
jgi:hypothetical protein